MPSSERFSFPIFFVALAVCTGLYYLTYQFIANDLSSDIRHQLQISVASASQTLDANNIRDIRSSADVEKLSYRTTLKYLRKLHHEKPEITYIYIMRRENKQAFFVVDSDESEKQALPGREYTAAPASLFRGFTTVSVDNNVLEDEWGVFFSAYAPIRNSNGEYLLGMDISAERLDQHFFHLRLIVILVFLALALISFLIARRV